MTEETLTHAFTAPQPHAWALAAGHCPVWNSTTRPTLGAEGKLVGIHAGRRLDWAGFSARVCTPEPLVFGALIGVARLVGVVRVLRNGKTFGLTFERMVGRSIALPCDKATCERIRPWWRGPWGWLLEEAVLLPEPIPMRGGGGMWRIPHLALNRVDPATLEVSPRLADSWALEQWRKAREGR